MKRLVLCCDGTWNRADQKKAGSDDPEQVNRPCATNVLKLASRVAKRDEAGNHQVVFYDQGVGTGNSLDRLAGGALGKGLEENIHEAYRFLVANYEPGDQIYLFGFSRGAFTARSIAGMVRNCGILKRTSVGSYLDALELYRDADRVPDHPDSIRFREEHSLRDAETGKPDIKICCLGVWDTVGSLGIPLRGLRWITRRKYQFHDVQLSRSIESAFHALAIDERRAPFAPTLWTSRPAQAKDVEQRWFCGAHSDVGGGYPERGLSDIALQWMMDKAGEQGLHLDPAVLEGLPLVPKAETGQLHNSKKGLYRVTKGIDRRIGFRPKDPAKPKGEQERDPTQSIDDSVRRRWNADPGYRPKSLREYFDGGGPADGWN